MAASPIPVLPDVGSIIVAPGLRIPFPSASSIIALATLSLTLPVALKYSSLTSTLALSPNFSSICPTSTSGVLPIKYAADLYIFPIQSSFLVVLFHIF